MMAEIPCRHRDMAHCSEGFIPCTGTISDTIDEDEMDCYEPRGVTPSDILAGIMCGLLMVAGSAIMLLFAASRVAWL